MTVARAALPLAQPTSASRPGAYWWWIAMYAGSLFLPPIPLTFTPTAHSKLLGGAIVAAAYLLWRPFFSHAGMYHFSNLRRLLPLALAFYVCAHAVYAVLIGNSIGALLEVQWLLYLAVPLMMTWDIGPAQGERVVRGLLVCLGIEAALAVISSFTGPMYEYVVLWYGPRFGASIYRAVGTTDSTNTLGGLMAFGALVCLFAPARALPIKRAPLLAVLLAAVVFSQSKSAFLSVVISLLVVSPFSIRPRARRAADWLRTLGLQVLALVSFSGVFYFYGSAVLDNMAQDYVDRTALSERVIAEIMKFDWGQALFGVGFHGVDYINPATGVWITAHDSYINLAADLGAVGFLLVASLLVVLLVRLVRQGQWHLVAGLLGLILHFFTEAFLYTPLLVMTLGTLYGIGCIHGNAGYHGSAVRSRRAPLAVGTRIAAW